MIYFGGKGNEQAEADAEAAAKSEVEPVADPRHIFEPQPGNSNDLHLFFSPDDRDKAEYVVEVLRRAYELAI